MTTPPTPAPGWYPDPSGAPGTKWWNGTAWADNPPAPTTPPVPAAATEVKPIRAKLRKAAKWGAITFGVLMAIGLLTEHKGADMKPAPTSAAATPPPTAAPTPTTAATPSSIADTPATQDKIIRICQNNIRQGLKDPDSAKFGEWKAWRAAPDRQPPAGMVFHPDQGDVFYQASGTVNAKNAFGGYVGATPYFCNTVLPPKGSGLVETHEIDLGSH